MAEDFGFRCIVCPYDFTPNSEEGVEVAVGLARTFDADLHILHVVVVPPVYAIAQGEYVQGIIEDERRVVERAEGERRPSLEHLIASLGGGSLRLTVALRDGLHEDLVIREYTEGVEADLIVMASHGRRGVARFFLGSTVERVLRGAPCPVLVVRPREARERDRLTGLPGASPAP
jgi:nucleotide-binding universal stress UspA family protein